MGIKATIKNEENGIIAQVMIPASFSEVQLDKYISFSIEADKIGEDGYNPIIQMAKAIGEFTGIDLDKILVANVGDLYSETDDLDGSLRTLYGYILNLCGQYAPQLMTPETAGFEYKGERFTIPVIAQNVLGGLPILPTVSVLEAIEAFEIQRLTANMIDETGDENGSFRFTYYLRLLSIICRKEGEELPISESEREKFFTERSLFFREIPAEIALNVDFFLSSILPRSAMTNHAIGFLTLQNFVHRVATTKMKSKHGKGLLRIMKQHSNG